MAGLIVNDTNKNNSRDNIFDTSKNIHEKQYMIEKEIIKDFEQNIAKKEESALKKEFSAMHYSDQSLILESINSQAFLALVTIAGKEIKPETLLELHYQIKNKLIKLMGHKKISKKVEDMDNDDAMLFLQSLKRYNQIEVLRHISPSKRKILRTAKNYPANSIGFAMDRHFLIINETQTAKEALLSIKKQALEQKKSKRFYEVFVINSENLLVGTISIEKLLQSDDKELVKAIMNIDFIVLRTSDKKQEAAKIFNKYELNIVPILSPEGRLVGSLNIDTVRYIAEEEKNSDSLKISGSFTDFDEGIAKTTTSRFKWLLINLVTTAAASWIISFFEATIKEVTALAVLMPIAVSMGSNAGTQTVAVIIRAISLNHMNKGTFYQYLNKEFAMSIINAILFGIVCTVSVKILYNELTLALVFGASISLTLVVSVVAGVLTPVIMRALKTDPAITSIVALTAIVDATAFLSFLGFAKLFLT